MGQISSNNNFFQRQDLQKNSSGLFRKAGNKNGAFQKVDVSQEAIDAYLKQKNDPYAKRLNLFKKIRQERAERQEFFAESRRIYEELNGPIEAGFGGPSNSVGGDSELGMDYLA